MAQRTVVQLTDDLDGKPIGEGEGETVAFTYRGQGYEIDLSNKNLEALNNFLQKYIDAARPTGGTGSRPKRSSTGSRSRSAGDVDPKAVRAWAAEHGVEVNSRGRLSANVLEKYKAAQG